MIASMEGQVSVLWVDGCADTRKLYETLLQAIGVGVVVTSACGEAALGIAAATAFDLVILDSSLTGYDAGVVARRLRNGVGASRSARLLLVADDRRDLSGDDAHALDAVLVRPVTARALRDEVAAAAARRKSAK